MSKIAILGSGRVATALASKLSPVGHDVTLGTRDVDATAGKWTGPAVTFATPAEAVATAEIVINATPGETSVERLGELRDALAGKILVDIANATARGENGMPGGLLYAQTSLAEELQKALPDTKVVKTLNTMLFTVMVNPGSLKSPATAFLSGNDEEAKARVRDLLSDLGWQGEQIEDLGGVASARAVEPFLLLVPTILQRYGFAPFALSLAR